MIIPVPAITEGFKDHSYWLDQTPLPAGTMNELPTRTDVVIVGAGLSGIMTALHLARAGCGVTVIEAARPAEFASSRNFGAIGRTIRLGFSTLIKQYGLEDAIRIYTEAREWADTTADFIHQEKIDCGFARAGRVVAAHSQPAYDASARELELMQRHIDVATIMLPRHEQHQELNSDVYYGCAVYSDVGHLDPMKYYAAVYRLAVAAGVSVIDQTPVIDINQVGGEYKITTTKGHIHAEQVVVATNAETPREGGIFPYLHRRTLPVSLYSGVSIPLSPDLMAELFPASRTMLETRRLYTGLRPIVGENRLLVVGQHLKHFGDLSTAAYALRLDIAARYPALANIQFSHVWHGRFCITFDWLPHLGSYQGIHYLHGLNGAGIPVCGYLGHKLAMRMLGRPGGDTVFADRHYPRKIGYKGNAWFMPLVGNWYRWLDRREAKMKR
ncbi:MAG: glycine/D-amino acid oxidase-like deaminating enzyme [Gammaproteobacteria bacterium]|jgi:glycine/D-amino acid oxidase-like deaminating enzyme